MVLWQSRALTSGTVFIFGASIVESITYWTTADDGTIPDSFSLIFILKDEKKELRKRGGRRKKEEREEKGERGEGGGEKEGGMFWMVILGGMKR